MAKRENFTAERVAAFKCQQGKQQSIYWDGKSPGLGLRVTSAGAKSYVFETSMHNKTIRVTIGDVRTWTIGKAQAEARRLRTLTDQGIDPRLERVKQRARVAAEHAEIKRNVVTLGDAWEEYLKARKAKWSDRTYKDHVRLSSMGGADKKIGKGETKAGPLAELMPLRLAELSGIRIAEWLIEESKTRPTSA